MDVTDALSLRDGTTQVWLFNESEHWGEGGPIASWHVITLYAEPKCIIKHVFKSSMIKLDAYNLA